MSSTRGALGLRGTPFVPCHRIVSAAQPCPSGCCHRPGCCSHRHSCTPPPPPAPPPRGPPPARPAPPPATLARRPADRDGSSTPRRPHERPSARRCRLGDAGRRWSGGEAAAVTSRRELHMGIDDLKNKAGDALDSDKGEKSSDAGLDKASDAASKATGGSHDEQIDKVQESADDRIGTA